MQSLGSICNYLIAENTMEEQFTWKKGVFSSLYKIYLNGEQIGSLKDKLFSQSITGILNGEEYVFQTKGFFKQETLIFDVAQSKVIGGIDYSGWMTRATITVNGKTIDWKYDNLWNTQWSIIDSKGIRIKYAGSSTSGKIESNVDDALLLLSGLFVTNYYWQLTIAILVVVFVPLLARMF